MNIESTNQHAVAANGFSRQVVIREAVVATAGGWVIVGEVV